jgi:Ca2+-binding RTX toxin-like protein
MAVLFGVAALFLVRGGHAATHSGPACTITGTPAADNLIGTPKREVICGLGGNDVVDGNGGNDVIKGGTGNDILGGGNGNDVVYGGAGADKIFAWDGFADRIDGGAGVDRGWKDMLDHVVRVERLS